MMSIQMMFHAAETPDGLIHIQYTVYPYCMRGQHHIHSLKGFRRWKRIAGIHSTDITLERGECGCGLKLGDVRDHEGNVTHRQDFE